MQAPDTGGESTTRKRKSTARRVLQPLFSLAIVVIIFVFVLPKIADLGEVWDAIQAMTGAEISVLSVVATWNLCTYWFVWVSVLPGLKLRQAAIAAEASTALANTVPGGSYLSIALTYAMFHSWGFRRSVVTLALLISGIWNNFAKLAIPVLALACLALQGGVTPGRVVAATLGIAGLVGAIALFALALRTEQAAARLGNFAARVASAVLRIFHRPPATGWDIAVIRFRQKTIGLLRTRWHVITLFTIISQLSLYAVLLAALRQVGVSNAEVNWAEVLAVFAFARLVTAIPLTPGGVGVMELALIGGLVAAGGDRPEVVAAVLVYRVLTYLVPIPLGLISYVIWRLNTSWRKAPQPGPSETAPVAAT